MQAIDAIGFGAEFGPHLAVALESKKERLNDNFLIFLVYF